MKTVKEINRLVQTFYTPMNMEQELVLLQYIQELDKNDIKFNLKDFYSILDLLHESQMDNYVFDNNIKIKDEIKLFIIWLEGLLKEIEINKDKIEDIIDIFSIDD